MTTRRDIWLPPRPHGLVSSWDADPENWPRGIAKPSFTYESQAEEFEKLWTVMTAEKLPNPRLEILRSWRK